MNEHQASNSGRLGQGTHRARQPPGIIEDAARAYADAVSRDHATWVWGFLSALRTNGQLARAGPGCRNIVDSGVPSGALLRFDLYARRAHELYSKPARGALSPVRVRPGEHQECVEVRIRDETYSGVLIAPHAVLTTAQVALYADAAEVLISRAAGERYRRFDVRGTLPHPGFDRATHLNDLGLLLLREPVDGVPCAHIGTARQVETAASLRMVGFRAADRATGDMRRRKRLVLLPVVAAQYMEALGIQGCHAGRELIVGKPAFSRDGYMGFGGEPLYARYGNRWYLAGLFSRPIQESGFPYGSGDICVRVDRYDSWIHEMIAREYRRDER
jgi:hypothetical protein